MGEDKKRREDKPNLTWKDHLALFVALVETVMVPAVILIVVLLLLIAYAAFVR